jgi:peptidoglycan/LPS O-acetylase OafA/YrhL
MRVKALDVLRAIAVLLVIGRHFDIVGWWTMAGWTGVNLFFVLSGFLISGLLFSEFKTRSRIHVGHFLVRRGFKIYPPFYLMIGWTLGMFFIYRRPVPWPRFFGEFFFLQNYDYHFWSHTWSLAVEEHFYIALPLLLVILTRVSRNPADPFQALPRIFLAIAVAVLATRLWVAYPLTESAVVRLLRTTYEIDGLLFGVLISYFFHFRRAAFLEFCQRGRPWIALASCTCLAPVFFLDMLQSYFVQTAGHTLLYLGYGGVMILAVTGADLAAGKVGKTLGVMGEALAYVGRYSYSIYLWHVPVVAWGMDLLARKQRLPASREAQFLIYLGSSLLIGIAMSKLVEYPALKVRDRLFPSRSAALTPASSDPSGAEQSSAIRIGDSARGLMAGAEPPILEKG